MKKVKVAQDGPMYNHTDFHTSASLSMCTVAINMKGASMLDLISQATDIQSEKFEKWTPLIW